MYVLFLSLIIPYTSRDPAKARKLAKIAPSGSVEDRRAPLSLRPAELPEDREVWLQSFAALPLVSSQQAHS